MKSKFTRPQQIVSHQNGLITFETRSSFRKTNLKEKRQFSVCALKINDNTANNDLIFCQLETFILHWLWHKPSHRQIHQVIRLLAGVLVSNRAADRMRAAPLNGFEPATFRLRVKRSIPGHNTRIIANNILIEWVSGDAFYVSFDTS